MKTQQIIKLSIFLLALCSITLASAQGGPRGPRGKNLDAEKLKAELQLTDQQVEQIEALTSEQRSQMQALRDQEFENREDRRAAMKEIHTAYQNGLAEILNDEQELKLKAIRQEARSQRQARAQEFGKQRQAARSEMGAYRSENIQPVILEQRAKLESKISAEDKALIATLRAQKPERPKRLENPSMEERKAAKEDFEARKEEMKAHREQVKALVETYESDIDALFAEIQPQIEEWKQDMKEIAQEHRPEHREKRAEGEAGRKGKKGKAGKRGKRKHRGERGEHAMMSKGAFLLLDPNSPMTNEAAAPQAITEIRVFPNPTFNQNTLSYTVKEAGHLRIELHNESGRLIEVLFDGSKEKGTYQLEVDMSKLRNGVYYYTVQDQAGLQSHKVIVNK